MTYLAVVDSAVAWLSIRQKQHTKRRTASGRGRDASSGSLGQPWHHFFFAFLRLSLASPPPPPPPPPAPPPLWLFSGTDPDGPLFRANIRNDQRALLLRPFSTQFSPALTCAGRCGQWHSSGLFFRPSALRCGWNKSGDRRGDVRHTFDRLIGRVSRELWQGLAFLLDAILSTVSNSYATVRFLFVCFCGSDDSADHERPRRRVFEVQDVAYFRRNARH